jgi:hypothetical protein
MKKILILFILTLIPLRVYAEEFAKYNVKITDENGAIAYNESGEPQILPYEEILEVINTVTENEKEYLIVKDINGYQFKIEPKYVNNLEEIEASDLNSSNEISVDLAGKQEQEIGGTKISSDDIVAPTQLNWVELVLIIVGGGVTLSFVIIAIKNRILLKKNQTPTITQ